MTEKGYGQQLLSIAFVSIFLNMSYTFLIFQLQALAPRGHELQLRLHANCLVPVRGRQDAGYATVATGRREFRLRSFIQRLPLYLRIRDEVKFLMQLVLRENPACI